MKDHVKSSHLTKFDAFRVNRDQVIDLETWFKIYTIIEVMTEHQRKNVHYVSYMCMYIINCKP